MKIKGGCLCGDIRFEANGESQGSIQCHCRQCQYITGGHPNVLMIMPMNGFNFIKNKPKKYKREDIDNAFSRLFCQNCGTAIGTLNPMRPDSIILKVGTFDDPSVFEPKIAIFTCDRQNFHYIADDVKSFDKRP